MTPEVRAFIFEHRGKLKGDIVEIGSLSVNGDIRDIVKIKLGVDMRPGKGVDLVCSINDIFEHCEKQSFDGCVSTETLEHVEDWKAFIRNTWDLVKDGGYLVMTMASKEKGRHAYPDDYWRMDETHIKQIWPNVEHYDELGRVSIGWVVKKDGALGDLDKLEPYIVP